MSTSLIQSLDTEITQAHEQIAKCFEAGGNLLVEAANARRNCGLLLLKRKENTPHGEWLDLLKNDNAVVFPFDLRTAQRYMAMAKHHPEEFTDLASVLRYQSQIGQDAGLLPQPEERQQSAHNQTFATALVSVAGRFQSAWTKFDAENWLAGLSDEGKAQARDQVSVLKERVDTLWEAVKE
jgi:hypothetical protein